MFVVAIITGIICDTFGELRSQQDEALAFRSTTNFITGLPFDTVPVERSTHYVNYIWLMLYLRRRAPTDTSPLELHIQSLIEQGDIGWFPDGRCLTLEYAKSEDGLAVNLQLDQIRREISRLQASVDAIVQSTELSQEAEP